MVVGFLAGDRLPNVRGPRRAGASSISHLKVGERTGLARVVPEAVREDHRVCGDAHPGRRAIDQRITSTYGGLSANDAAPVLEMNPADAAARGLVDGAVVRIWNELGEVHLPLLITAAVRPGVISSDKGAWLCTSPNGQTVSALAPTHKADLADGACFNDARVEVSAL